MELNNNSEAVNQPDGEVVQPPVTDDVECGCDVNDGKMPESQPAESSQQVIEIMDSDWEEEELDDEIPIIVPGYHERLRSPNGNRKLKFKLSENLFFVVLSRFVLGRNVIDDSDEDLSPQKRYVRLSLEVCKDMLLDHSQIIDMCKDMLAGNPVEFRGAYTNDIHLLTDYDRDYFEIRRCYFRNGTYHRTNHGVIVHPSEMLRLIKLIEASASLMKQQVRKIYQSNVNLKGASPKKLF